MIDPFDDDYLLGIPGPKVDQKPRQLVMARWLMKLKCRRLRMIRSHLRTGTWRYFIHGDLERHREQLHDMYEEYQLLLELYEIDIEKEAKKK